MRRFDLHSLHFHGTSEAWRELPVEVEPLLYGGVEYRLPDDDLGARLTAARVGDNLTLTLELQTQVDGPCQRCLEDIALPVAARGVEYVRQGESEGDDEDEGYVAAYQVDLERWVRDLIAEALPSKLLCRDDCRGLCSLCGANLNAEPEHHHGQSPE